MTDTDDQSRLDEIDRLLNDPDVHLQPARVWALLAEIRRAEPSVITPGQTA